MQPSGRLVQRADPYGLDQRMRQLLGL
jgi:hypothetical protein